MVSVGASAPTTWWVVIVVAEAALVLAEGVHAAGAVDVEVGVDVESLGHADVEMADVSGHVDLASVQRLRRDVGEVDDQLTAVHLVAALHLRGRRRARHRAVDVPSVGDRQPRGDGVGDEPDQDDPAGPAEERPDQEEHGAQPEHRGGVRRGCDVGAGEVGDPEDTEGDGHHRQREPEQDRALLARVDRTRLLGHDVRRGRGRRGRGRRGRRHGALVRRGRTVAAVGELGGDHDRGCDHDQADEEPSAAAPPAVLDQQEQRQRADDDQGDRAAATVELDLRPVAAVLGQEQPQRDVQQQADAAEEGEDHERHPQDHRVDVEVTSEPAGDSGDLAVGPAAPDPGQVADVVPSHAGAGVRCGALGGGVGWCRGHVIQGAPSARRTPSGEPLIAPAPSGSRLRVRPGVVLVVGPRPT